MPLTQVIGWKGTGKTLICVLFVLLFHRLYPDKKIYSNIEIKNFEFTKLTLKHLLKLKIGSFLIWDEAYAIINARRSMSYINILASFLVFQLRKTNCNIFLSCQQLRTIDVIYRDEWDYRIYCERIPNEYIKRHMWDFIFEIHSNRTKSIKTFTVKYDLVKKFFKYFNTIEIVDPYYKDEIEYELAKAEGTIMPEARERLKIIKKDIRKMTGDGIELALLENGFSPKWKKPIYLEVKT